MELTLIVVLLAIKTVAVILFNIDARNYRKSLEAVEEPHSRNLRTIEGNLRVARDEAEFWRRKYNSQKTLAEKIGLTTNE